MKLNFRYYMPANILFGPGSLNQLATTKLPGKKALIVFGGSSMRKQGYLDRVISLLKTAGVETVEFDKILPNPIVEHVMEGAALAKEEGCDFVIGLGGGSSMDSAKSIAVMAKNPGHYWDYIHGGTGKGMPVENGALPIVCITTTAGTGTESDPWTVITKGDTNEKIGFGCDYTFPTLSIVDAELMMTVPAHLTAFQGFDAFFHAAEGYIANIANPMSDMYALKSIELIARNLATAVREPLNIEARSAVALANTLSGFVETTSCCTSEHALEHALSAFHPELPHGAGLIMVSKAYFKHFSTVVPERLADMARAMGADPTAEGFLQALADLQTACGVDNLKMSDYGITKDKLPEYAENARFSMGSLFELDPAPLTEEDTTKILVDSFK